MYTFQSTSSYTCYANALSLKFLHFLNFIIFVNKTCGGGSSRRSVLECIHDAHICDYEFCVSGLPCPASAPSKLLRNGILMYLGYDLLILFLVNSFFLDFFKQFWFHRISIRHQYDIVLDVNHYQLIIQWILRNFGMVCQSHLYYAILQIFITKHSFSDRLHSSVTWCKSKYINGCSFCTRRTDNVCMAKWCTKSVAHRFFFDVT